MHYLSEALNFLDTHVNVNYIFIGYALAELTYIRNNLDRINETLKGIHFALIRNMTLGGLNIRDQV